MNRYDLITGKKKGNKLKKSSDGGDFGDNVKATQTPSKGSSLLIRGPNGYQTSVPMRFVTVHLQQDNNELILKLPASVARNLFNDLYTSILPTTHVQNLNGFGDHIGFGDHVSIR
jgi:hypothetical protein